jgi:hypothetical protein
MSTRTAHEEDEWDGKTQDDGWEDERYKMSIRAFRGDDEWDGKTKRTIEGRMKRDGMSTRTMHGAMNGMGRLRGRRVGG